MQDKEKALSADLASARSDVNDALLDSINLSGALDALLELVRKVNRYLNEREASVVKNEGVAACCLLSACFIPWCQVLVEVFHGCDEDCEGLLAIALVKL